MTAIVENESHTPTYELRVKPGVTLTVSPSNDPDKPWLLESHDWNVPIGVNGHNGYFKIAVAPDDLVTIGADQSPVDLRGLIQSNNSPDPYSQTLATTDDNQPTEVIPYNRTDRSEETHVPVFNRWICLLSIVTSLSGILMYLMDYPLSWVKPLLVTACLSGACFEYIYWKPYFKQH